ncbi:MAG: sugar ABC transporter ATP-binding protein [Roseiarcus sp.]
MPSLLRMTGILKRFGPIVALDKADFSVERGEIHALLGVNGAGKSTLVKILSGLYTLDDGTIEIDGAQCSFATPADAIRAGVAAVQQHPELVGDLSGYENIFLGQESSRSGFFRRVDHSRMRARADRLIARFPLEIDLAKPVEQLSKVEREAIAVLHALKQDNIRILILDEPTSTFTRVEKAQLFAMMQALKATGIAIIYITHRLEEVFEIADRFTVFRGGKNIATMSSEESAKNRVSIPQLMLQESLGSVFPGKSEAADGAIALEVRDLEVPGAFRGVSFAARRGEILGVFGLVGSGIDELAKTLFGATSPRGGEILLHGQRKSLRGSRAALRAGIFLVPGDRRKEGLVLNRDVILNTILASLGRASHFWGLLRFRQNRARVAALAKQLQLSPPNVDRPATAFSGGNQQKIVVAKGLFARAEVYIFVEPTAGVDVGAQSKLYRLIRELSRDAAVIVMSSDCNEVFGLGDTMLAMYRGSMPFKPSRKITRDQLLAAGIMGAHA